MSGIFTNLVYCVIKYQNLTHKCAWFNTTYILVIFKHSTVDTNASCVIMCRV